VNSQLKKRPGSRFVREIPHDTKDGVALVQLVEVLGKSFYLPRAFVLTVVITFFILRTFYEKCDNTVWSLSEVSLDWSFGKH